MNNECRVSQEERDHDAATIDFDDELLSEKVARMVEDDDYFADALAEPEATALARMIWGAVPKGREGGQPRDLTGIYHEDAVVRDLLADLALRFAASITDYMEQD